MAEFRAITSADNLDQLRRKLKKEDYHPNGEPFLPDMVYSCIRKLSAFATVWVSKTCLRNLAVHTNKSYSLVLNMTRKNS